MISWIDFRFGLATVLSVELMANDPLLRELSEKFTGSLAQNQEMPDERGKKAYFPGLSSEIDRMGGNPYGDSRMTPQCHEARSRFRSFHLPMSWGVFAILFAVLRAVSSSADGTNSGKNAILLTGDTANTEPGIPYTEGPSFATPSTWGGNTNSAIPSSLPPELMPFGMKNPTDPSSKSSAPTNPVAKLPVPAPSLPSPQAPPSSPSNTNAENPEIAMRRDFSEWIQENQRSAEKAQKIAEKYKELSGKTTNDLSFEMIVKLRFPYIGTESPPPGGGSVIYTTPKH